MGDFKRPAISRGTFNQSARSLAPTTVTGVRKGLSFSAVVGVGYGKRVGMQDPTVNKLSPFEKPREAVAGLPNLREFMKTSTSTIVSRG